MLNLTEVNIVSPLVPFLVEYYRVRKLMSHSTVHRLTGISECNMRMIEHGMYVPSVQEWEKIITVLNAEL